MMKLIIMCLILVAILIIESESKSDNLLEKFLACINDVNAELKKIKEQKKKEVGKPKQIWFKNKMEAEKDLKIVNGTLADIINFPYMSYVAFCRAEILIQNYCGGNIITEYHILTAAHCCVIKKDFRPFYEKKKPEYFIIIVGTSYDYIGGKSLKVTEVHIHPDYLLVGTYGRDLAVLKAAEKFPMSNRVATIPVATPELSHQLQGMENSRTECVVAGWGHTKSNETEVGHIRSVIFPLIPINQCIKFGRINNCTVYRKLHLCTYRRHKAFCFGDSGGGLVCRGADGVRRIWGVASFVTNKYQCTGRQNPVYFARVDNAESFLEEFLGTKSTPSAATLHKAVLKLLFPLVLQVSSSSLR